MVGQLPRGDDVEGEGVKFRFEDFQFGWGFGDGHWLRTEYAGNPKPGSDRE